MNEICGVSLQPILRSISQFVQGRLLQQGFEMCTLGPFQVTGRCLFVPCTEPCWGCWWSCHWFPSKQWRTPRCGETKPIDRGSITVWPLSHSHETQSKSKHEKEKFPFVKWGGQVWRSAGMLERGQGLGWHLHIYLCVVDEILQWVSAWVEVLELGVVGDSPYGRVKGADHTTYIDRLNVWKVREYSHAWWTRGLKKYRRTSVFQRLE